MKSILTIVIILVVSALVPSTLYAGAAATTELSIEFNSDGTGVAAGNMWLTRSSKNDVEVIGCSTKGDVVDGKWAWCRARDASGVQVLCLTTDENLLDALQSISPFSFIRFEFSNAAQDNNGDWIADCTRFDFSIQSLHLPLFVTKGKQ